jgi:hypothetical protein
VRVGRPCPPASATPSSPHRRGWRHRSESTMHRLRVLLGGRWW